MTLQEWLKLENITVPQFAEILGVKLSAAYYYVRGERKVPIEKAYLIEEASKGMVTRAELYWPDHISMKKELFHKEKKV